MQNTSEKVLESTELLTAIETACVELRKRKSQLTLELSTADKKKSDIEHYIELYPLSASQGYKASKMLKDCLEERRNIKDELQMIDNAFRMNIGYMSKGNARNVLVNTEDKQYKPRVLKELFN